MLAERADDICEPRAADTSASPPVTHRAGVIGSPIDHSLSPVLHRAAYRACGLPGWQYDRHLVGGPGEVSVAEFVAGLGSEWVGVSATMPCKEPALAVADEATPLARLVGSANTLIRRDGGWLADNTDVAGLAGVLDQLDVPADEPAVLLGAGATARSALAALAQRGCRSLRVAVRGQVRELTGALADELGMELIPIGMEDVPEAVAQAPLTLFILPSGTEPGFPPAPAGSLAGHVVIDAGYGAWPTPLARWARAGGAHVVSGLPMLIHQAAEQFRLMTGLEAPLAAMYAAVADQPGAPDWTPC